MFETKPTVHFRFTDEFGETTKSLSFDSDIVTWFDLQEAFEDFLEGIGYVIPFDTTQVLEEYNDKRL